METELLTPLKPVMTETTTGMTDVPLTVRLREAILALPPLQVSALRSVGMDWTKESSLVMMETSLTLTGALKFAISNMVSDVEEAPMTRLMTVLRSGTTAWIMESTNVMTETLTMQMAVINSEGLSQAGSAMTEGLGLQTSAGTSVETD